MAKPPTIAILNGPNLNALGRREALYGNLTLTEIEEACRAYAKGLALEITFFQSQYEGALIEQILDLSHHKIRGLLFNPGAYTHTSLALHDALKSLTIPIVEVHLTNIYQRETYRHHSYTGHAASGIIAGFGLHSYLLGLQAISSLL